MKGTHTGWTEQEDAALLSAALDARRARQPLKSAFDAIAEQTARRPNSVRNHYYTQLKPAEKTEPAFLPFSEEETDRLLETVLLALSNGQSVRACTLEMADGDTRRMLRYQNKYRALLKSQPDRVRAARGAPAEGDERAGSPHPRAARESAEQPAGADAGRERRLIFRKGGLPSFFIMPQSRRTGFMAFSTAND